MGKEKLMETKTIFEILLLIEDKVDSIRKNVYLAFLNFCEFRSEINYFNFANCDDYLVDKFTEEKEENILILILKLYNKILDGEGWEK